MPTTVSFVLNFSGQNVFEQSEAAEALLEQASTDDHRGRARLNATLAAARVFTDAEAAQAAARAAKEAAAQAGDDVSRAWSLLALCVVDLSCGVTDGRREATSEVLRIAELAAEPGLVPFAYFLHLATLAELGRIGELDDALSPVGRIMGAFPWLDDGRHAAWFRCLRATLDGHAEGAEELANLALGIAQSAGDPDAQSVWVGQIAIIRWMQGRVVELEPMFLLARQGAPHEPVWAVSLAWIWLQQGRKSAARALLSSLPPLGALPVDRNWLSTTCILAVVAAELEEVSLAAELYTALLPFADRLVTIGLGVTCWGTVARPLALLAAACGDTDAAIGHYRDAISISGRTGAHPWLAEAQVELAALLAERPGDASECEALALVCEAAAAGRALQLPGVEGAASTMLKLWGAEPDPAAAVSGPPELAPAQPGGVPQIFVLGDFAVISACGVPARWQSRKARQLLKILVARRGAAVRRETLMHLLWPDEAPARLANRFSVASTVIRRALDPEGTHPSDAYLESRGGLVRLRTAAIDIDVERFLAQAECSLTPQPDSSLERERFVATLALYGGDPLADEPAELWAEDLRRDCHLAFFAVAHALAESAAKAGDELTRIESYRRILALDEYDQRAHEGLIASLTAVGSHGAAAEAGAVYAARMSALGVEMGADTDPGNGIGPLAGERRAH